MKITRLDHVQLTVPPGEVETAKAFYVGVLGLIEIEKPDALKPRGGFWILAGDRQVHIGAESGVERFKTKAHVAFEVEDLRAARVELTAVGIEIVESVAIPGVNRFEFRDPFGNRLEFLQPLP
jgi:catechol 2,3-dioxygenase-like lactoylglutathione lyase family enzyme